MKYSLMLYYMTKLKRQNLMKCGVLYKTRVISDGYGSQ